MRSDWIDRFRTFFSPGLDAAAEGVLGIMHSHWLSNFLRMKQYPNYFVMAFILRGRGWCRMSGSEHALSPGTVIVTQPRTEYERGVATGGEIEVVSVLFRGAPLESVLRHHLRMTHGVLRPEGFPRIRKILFEMIDDARGEPRFAREICAHHFATVLYLAARDARHGASSFTASELTYERLKAHMDARYLELRSAAAAADQCKVNYSYACRLFQRLARETPQDYLLRLRMNHAVQRLRYTDDRVKKVALDLGYADPYIFSKAFKRVMGAAPSHFRKRELVRAR